MIGNPFGVAGHLLPRSGCRPESGVAASAHLGTAMTRSRLFLVAFALVAVGVGAFFLVRYLNKSPGTTNTLIPGTAQTRKVAVEVPALRFADVTEKSGARFRHFGRATPQKLLPETMGGG